MVWKNAYPAENNMDPTPISTVDASLSRWEMAEYIAFGFVILGVAGEFIAEFPKIVGDSKDAVNRWSTLLLIVALAAELICALKASAISHRIVEAERSARIQLEAQVAPRTLSPDQQRAIVDALRKYAGETVNVASYGLDPEGARIALQLITTLQSAGFHVTTDHAFEVVSGGFYEGIHLRGPKTEFLSSLDDALSNVGRLKTYVNGPTLRTGAAMSGGAAITGNAAISGSGGVTATPAPQSGPVSIFVGVKQIPFETK